MSLFLPYAHLCIFIDLSWHVVCFSRGFLLRFWHSVHISSHPMILTVSSVILLSFCSFRILEYLLGYFLEIGCMKILFCLCAGLIFYALWITVLLIFFFGIHLTAVLNTTLFLELIGSNSIFGDISGWWLCIRFYVNCIYMIYFIWFYFFLLRLVIMHVDVGIYWWFYLIFYFSKNIDDRIFEIYFSVLLWI